MKKIIFLVGIFLFGHSLSYGKDWSEEDYKQAFEEEILKFNTIYSEVIDQQRIKETLKSVDIELSDSEIPEFIQGVLFTLKQVQLTALEEAANKMRAHNTSVMQAEAMDNISGDTKRLIQFVAYKAFVDGWLAGQYQQIDTIIFLKGYVYNKNISKNQKEKRKLPKK